VHSAPLHPAVDPHHDLTAREFLKDVGADFAGLVSTRSLLPIAVGGAGFGLATIPEQALERHFARGGMWGAWSEPGKYIANPMILGAVSGALFGISRKSDSRKFRSVAYSLFQGMIVTVPITQGSKVITHRLRPNGQDHKAFPSGHSVDGFMFATVLTDHYGWKVAIPAYTVAAYVCATRLEERKHHLTDVVVGSAIGYLIGRTVSRRVRGVKPSRFTWQVYPNGRGFTATAQIALR
jgi:membrane-associated phospholipid phosphatase